MLAGRRSLGCSAEIVRNMWDWAARDWNEVLVKEITRRIIKDAAYCTVSYLGLDIKVFVWVRWSKRCDWIFNNKREIRC